jgi:benzodiazapine receptor
MTTHGWRDPFVFILLTLIVNGLLFTFGWNEGGSSGSRVAPPGWVVGSVWVVLLGLLGAAHARLRDRGPGSVAPRRAMLVLLLLCLAYPLYTFGFSSDLAALLGNFVVLAWACATVVMASHLDRVAGALVVPMVLWIGYANVIVGAALG